MKPQNTKIWLTLLIIPIPLLIFNSIIQIIVRAANNGQGNIVMNIFSLVVGLSSVLLLLGSPAWLYLYIRATNANKAASPASKSPLASPPNGPVQPK